MGTVATATNISGVSCIGPEMFMAVYTVALDTTDGTGIQTVDLTSDFSYIHAGWFCGNDTLADNGYKMDLVLPTHTTAISSSNVEISVHGAGTAGADFDAVASTGLTAIGDLRMVIIGRQAT